LYHTAAAVMITNFLLCLQVHSYIKHHYPYINSSSGQVDLGSRIQIFNTDARPHAVSFGLGNRRLLVRLRFVITHRGIQ
jgi:hypothetical protein